jgi:hypothetical protein
MWLPLLQALEVTLNQEVKPSKVLAFKISKHYSPRMVTRSEICMVLMFTCKMVTVQRDSLLASRCAYPCSLKKSPGLLKI